MHNWLIVWFKQKNLNQNQSGQQLINNWGKNQLFVATLDLLLEPGDSGLDAVVDNILDLELVLVVSVVLG